MIAVLVPVAGPDWATIMTAVGTVLVAVVAVGVALYAEWRADKRLAQERARHDKEISDERRLSEKRLAEQHAHSEAQLAKQLAHSDAQFADQQVLTEARLAEERRQARAAEQLAEAWSVEVAGGRVSLPGGYTGPDAPMDVQQHPVVVLVNKGHYTITRVDARFSEGRGIIGQVITQPFADFSELPHTLARDIVGEIGNVYLGVLTPGAAMRFVGSPMTVRDLGTVYPIARWTDRWGTHWEHKQGQVRQVADSEQWHP